MSDHPTVTADPAHSFGRPRVGGVPITAVVDCIRAGESVTQAAEEYALTRGQVLVACWFVACYGVEDIAQQGDRPAMRWGDSMRLRWWRWAWEHQPELARGEFDKVPDPPREGK